MVEAEEVRQSLMDMCFENDSTTGKLQVKKEIEQHVSGFESIVSCDMLAGPDSQVVTN